MNGLSEQTYLRSADTDWLLADNPGYALQQGGCGQRAIVCPVVEAPREQSGGVEVDKSSLPALRTIQRATLVNKKHAHYDWLDKKNVAVMDTYFGLDGNKCIYKLLKISIFSPALKDKVTMNI